jgi:hypothetical protein
MLKNFKNILQGFLVLVIWNLDLFFVSDFGFRASDFPCL